MKNVRIDIKPQIIDWAIEQIQDDKPHLAEILLKWKIDKKPTFNQVLKISRETNIPFGYFFLKEPPRENLELLEYRTIDSLKLTKPSRNLIDTIRYMENIKDWMRDYLIGNDYSPRGFVGSLKNSDEAYQIAKRMRIDLGIAPDWFKECKDDQDAFNKLRKKFENIGILVMMNGVVGSNTHRKLDLEEFRAFTLFDEYAPLIFINSRDSINGKLFSLLHEGAHIWLGQSNLYNDDFLFPQGANPKEKICNAVAAEILVPNRIFLEIWKEIRAENLETKIEKTARFFKCGMSVIVRRAFDNRFIDYVNYKFLTEKAKAIFKSKQTKNKSGHFYYTLKSRIDNRFLMALDSSVNEGKTLHTEAYRLTNTNRTTFSKLIETVRGIT